MTSDQLERTILELPAEERVRLVERIVASLEAEDVRLHEFERRVQEFERRRSAPLQSSGSDRAKQLAELLEACPRPHALDDFIEAWRRERAGRSDPSIDAW